VTLPLGLISHIGPPVRPAEFGTYDAISPKDVLSAVGVTLRPIDLTKSFYI
jgi:hypothetical protein